MTYINPRQKPLAHLDRLVGWQRGEKPAPVTLEWDLSFRCPYGCNGCHMAHTGRVFPTRLNMAASVLEAVPSVHLHSLKPNNYDVADDLHEMEVSRSAVGAALRRAVGIVGLSDKEAAALLGASPSQFSRWCLGKETLPLHRVYGTKLHGPFAIEQARDAAGCVVETTVTYRVVGE